MEKHHVDVCQTKLEPECLVKEEPIESEHMEIHHKGEGVPSFEHQGDSSFVDIYQTKIESEYIVKDEPIVANMAVMLKEEDIKQESNEGTVEDPLSDIKDTTSIHAADGKSVTDLIEEKQELDLLKEDMENGLPSGIEDTENVIDSHDVNDIDGSDISMPMPMVSDAVSMMFSQQEDNFILPNESLGLFYSNLNKGQSDDISDNAQNFLSQSKPGLNNHKKTVHGDDLREYVAYYKSQLPSHQIAKHKKDCIKKYHCDLCDFSTDQKSRLPVHIRAKHKKQTLSTKKYRCCLCDSLYNSTHELTVHERTWHKDAMRFNCDLCDFVAVNQTRLTLHHREKHTKRQKVVTAGANTKIFCATAIYRCSLCDFVPDSTHGLNDHIKTWHKDVLVSCDLCEYVTLHKSFLTTHIRDQHYTTKRGKSLIDYICDICKCIYITQSGLDEHVRMKHPPTHKSDTHCTVEREKTFNDYICDICKCIYISQSGLDEHVKLKHPK